MLRVTRDYQGFPARGVDTTYYNIKRSALCKNDGAPDAKPYAYHPGRGYNLTHGRPFKGPMRVWRPQWSGGPNNKQ
jgi:hypothetical protein